MTSRYPLVLNGTTIQELQTGDTLTGFASSGANSDITSLSGLTTPLSPSQGGTGLSSLAANVATFLQTPSSANLAAALTDKTGTAGKVVFDTNPIFPAQINLTANSGYNIYASGTADNYLAGSLGVGGAPYAGVNVLAAKGIGGAAISSNFTSTGTILSSVTSRADAFISYTGTQAATFTLGELKHYGAYQAPFGAGSAVTYQYGFYADSGLTDAVNNYGFYGGIASGTGRYNLFMAGTADNYMAGNLLVNAAQRFSGAGGSWFWIDNSSATTLRFSSGSTAGSAGQMYFTDSGSLGIGASPDVSAILDAQSTAKGVRFPNMTTTQKLAIASPAAGLVVFDTALSKLCVYTGAAWQTITSI